MINYNTLGNRLKIDLLNFSKKVTNKLTKTTQKFITDMVFGIISSNSCKLTEISRELKETIALKKTVERLSRNLSGFSEQNTIMNHYLTVVKPFLGSDTMLLVDSGDATKSCSPKMEAIGSVYDGSAGTYADGYWTMGACALSNETAHPIPVYENLYPCKKQGGLGFNFETKRCLQNLRENFTSDVPRIFDRGFDSGDIIAELIDKNEKFILRVNQNRVAVHNGRKSYINDIVRGLVCEHDLTFNSKTGNVSKCKIGITQIVLPNLKNLKLNLIVCKEFGEKPLILYSNISETFELIAARIVKAYLMRWRIEEFYAFKKQGFRFEDFRVRSLNSIKTLDLLVTIAAGFIGTLCEKVDTIKVFELIEVSKRIGKTFVFLKKTKLFFYSVLDGITRVFSTLNRGIAYYFSPLPIDYQLCFPGLDFLG